MEARIGNIHPETTDDDLRELVRKYTKLEVSQIRREPGDGSRPGAVLEFEGETARRFTRRSCA